MTVPFQILTRIDDTWIGHLRQGSQKAFERIMDATRGLVYTTALRITGRREEAEDILQDTFLRLWTHRADVQDLKAWLRRVAANRALDLLRKRKKDLAVAEREPPQSGEGIPEEKIHRALRELDPERQEVFVLRIFGGLSYREIGSQLGLSLGTVMSRLHRARRELYDGLKDEL